MAKSHQSYTPPILFIVPNSNIWQPLERCSSSCFLHRHLSNAALTDSMKNTLKTCITLVKNPSVKRESFRTPCEPICLKFSKDVAQLLFVPEKKKKKKKHTSFLSTEQFRSHVNNGRVRLSEHLFPCVHLQGLVAKRKSTFLIVFPAAGFTAYCKVQWTGSWTELQLQFFASIKNKKTKRKTRLGHGTTELKPQTGTAVVQCTWWTLSFILYSVAQRVMCSVWQRPRLPAGSA